MSCIKKQFVLNRLKLPHEIICIIKDYTFMNTMSNSKKKKNTIMRLISSTFWSSSRIEHEDDHVYIFWIDEDDSCPQFQISFCKKCGDYTLIPYNTGFDKVICQCNQSYMILFENLNI
jgi:hypothetical protein